MKEVVLIQKQKYFYSASDSVSIHQLH